MTRSIDDDARGLTNRGLDSRGLGAPAPSSRSSPGAPNTLAMQRGGGGGATPAATGTPGSQLPPPTNRTIFIVEDPVFLSIPADVRNATVAEIVGAFSFVTGPSITVRVLEPNKFPEAYAFSDAVVRVVASDAALQAHVNVALRTQGSTVVGLLQQQGVRFVSPFTRNSSKPERSGVSSLAKQIFSAGRQRFALPFMASAVSLGGVTGDVVEEVESKVQLSRVRDRRKGFSPRYWGSRQALEETEVLMAIDNPSQPELWSDRQRKLLGLVLGRAMAHEIRHLYVGPGHSRVGLGRDSAVLLKEPSFSPEDQRAILKAITTLEADQARSTLIRTFPGQTGSFPF